MISYIMYHVFLTCRLICYLVSWLQSIQHLGLSKFVFAVPTGAVLDRISINY